MMQNNLFDPHDRHHHDLVADLADHLHIPALGGGGTTPRWVTAHASLGSRWLTAQCPEADVLTVRGSHTQQEVAIYEVKANRADWRREMRSGKWESYLPYCHRLLFATPHGLIEREELPEGCGWIMRNDNGWHTVVAGERRAGEDVVWDEAAYSLLLGLMFSIGNQERTWHDRATRTKSLRHALISGDYDKLPKLVGEDVARHIRERTSLIEHCAERRLCPFERSAFGAYRTACDADCPRMRKWFDEHGRSNENDFWRRLCRKECWRDWLDNQEADDS